MLAFRIFLLLGVGSHLGTCILAVRLVWRPYSLPDPCRDEWKKTCKLRGLLLLGIETAKSYNKLGASYLAYKVVLDEAHEPNLRSLGIYYNMLQSKYYHA